MLHKFLVFVLCIFCPLYASDLKDDCDFKERYEVQTIYACGVQPGSEGYDLIEDYQAYLNGEALPGRRIANFDLDTGKETLISVINALIETLEPQESLIHGKKTLSCVVSLLSPREPVICFSFLTELFKTPDVVITSLVTKDKLEGDMWTLYRAKAYKIEIFFAVFDRLQ